MAKKSRDRQRSEADRGKTPPSPLETLAIRSAALTFLCRAVALIVCLIAGCSDSGPVPAEHSPAVPSRTTAPAEEPDQPVSHRPPPSRFQPVDLGDSASGPSPREGGTTEAAAAEERSQSIVAALQPFQILLGQWRWVTKRKFGEFPARGEDLEWVWDFRTDNSRPSLVALSNSNPYFHALRLTSFSDEAGFQLTIEDPNKKLRVLRGTWAGGGEAKEESDGRKLQRTYRLQFTQVEPAGGEQWQVTLSQLDNNQYVLDLKKRGEAGTNFGPLDVLNQQRVGTSFALADSDNPGPKCIISGGLGSMSVTYRGKSYPVCCSGCAAAFNDDPERWLAKFAKDEANRKTPADE